MGDENQFKFIEKHRKIVTGPVLEIGSKDYGNTPDLRSLFPDFDYIGCDMEDGKGVDIVIDFTNSFNTVNDSLKNSCFGSIICLSVLEHCKNPFQMCKNISKLLKQGGIVFISVPFSWRIHAYPSDYWRFTPDGVKLLFHSLDFDIYPGNVSTCKIGETKPINNCMWMLKLKLKSINEEIRQKRYGRLTSVFLHLFRRLGYFPKFFQYPYFLPPVMINMIGVKV